MPQRHSLLLSVNGKAVTNTAPFSDSNSLSCYSLSIGEISPSPECGLVLEDEVGLCGYALALTDAKQAAAAVQVIEFSI